MQITESDDPQGSSKFCVVFLLVFQRWGETNKRREGRGEEDKRKKRRNISDGQGGEKRIGQSDKQWLLNVTRCGLGTGILMNDSYFLSMLPKNKTLDKNMCLFIIQLVPNAQDI